MNGKLSNPVSFLLQKVNKMANQIKIFAVDRGNSTDVEGLPKEFRERACVGHAFATK